MLSKLKDKMDLVSSGINKIETILDKTPDHIHEERWNICSSCDKLWKPTSTCKVCGCFMKVKTWMPNQKCPIDKWGRYTKDDSK